MASKPQSGTIRTSIQKHNGGFRVRFSCPADGYTFDDLDALRIAIDHARQQLLKQQLATTHNNIPLLDQIQVFTKQQSRLAAPS